MPWRRGMFCLAVMLFLLIFAGGAERLIGRPEKQPETWKTREWNSYPMYPAISCTEIPKS